MAAALSRLGSRHVLVASGNDGLDAVLIADLPFEEFTPVADSARHHGVHPVCMVSELTSDARLAQIAEVGEGCIYVVAHLGVTGEQAALTTGLHSLLSRCHQHTRLPLLAGFGISTPAHARQALEAGADGVICGSAVVRRVAQTL
jgi:tryptophan synthase alpha chain